MAKSAVTIGELRDHLSAYLRRVRRGEEIVVQDRSTPIARITPYAPADEPGGELASLIATGELRPPRAAVDWAAFHRTRTPRLRGDDLLEELLVGREEED